MIRSVRHRRPATNARTFAIGTTKAWEMWKLARINLMRNRFEEPSKPMGKDVMLVDRNNKCGRSMLHAGTP